MDGWMDVILSIGKFNLDSAELDPSNTYGNTTPADIKSPQEYRKQKKPQ